LLGNNKRKHMCPVCNNYYSYSCIRDGMIAYVHNNSVQCRAGLRAKKELKSKRSVKDILNNL